MSTGLQKLHSEKFKGLFCFKPSRILSFVKLQMAQGSEKNLLECTEWVVRV